jgi:hypothetical protein
MASFNLREIMYPLTCLQSASDTCIPSQTEGFAPIQFKTLYTTVPETARVQAGLRPVTCHKSGCNATQAVGFGEIWQRSWLKYPVPQLGRSAQRWAMKFKLRFIRADP